MHASHYFNTLLELALLFIFHFGELDVLFGDSNVAGCMVEVHGTEVTCRCVDDSFLLIEGSSLPLNGSSSRFLFHIIPLILLIFFLILILNIPLRFLIGLLFSILPLIFRTRITNRLNLLYHIVAHTDHMDLAVDSVAAASDVAVEGNVDLVILCVSFVLISLPSIG